MIHEGNVQADINLEGYGRLRVNGVQLLLLLRILEDSLKTKDGLIFCYTYEFGEQLYHDIIAQQDQEVR